MKSYSNRVSGFARVAFAVAAAAGVLTPSSEVRAAASTTLEGAATLVPPGPTWTDMCLDLLERLLELLGGDPETLDRQPMAGKLVQVAGYYALHGLPTGLTATERQGLKDTVYDLYHLGIAEHTDPITAALFDAALVKIWLDLGLNLFDLTN